MPAPDQDTPASPTTTTTDLPSPSEIHSDSAETSSEIHSDSAETDSTDTSTMQASIDNLVDQVKTLSQQPAPQAGGFSSYLPPAFTGDSQENISQFIQKLECFSTFMNYTEEKIKALLPILLTGRAAAWYASLPSTSTDTWAALKAALVTKYGPNSIGFLQQSILLDRSQGPTETISAYANDIYQRLSLTGTQDPESWKTFVKGLRPELKCHVLTRQPTSLDQAQQFALEAEQLLTIQQPALLTTCAKVFQAMKDPSAPTTTTTTPVPSSLEKKLDVLLNHIQTSQAPTPAPAPASAPQASMDSLVHALQAIVVQPEERGRPNYRGNYRGRGSQYRGGQFHQRTNTGRPICGSCNRVGHYTNTCRYGSNTPRRVCYVCNSPDHMANRCPKRQGRSPTPDRRQNSHQGNV